MYVNQASANSFDVVRTEHTWLHAVVDHAWVWFATCVDGAGWVASGWSSDPPSYSAEFKTPTESYPAYPIQYATPYAGHQQNVVIVQPHVRYLDTFRVSWHFF